MIYDPYAFRDGKPHGRNGHHLTKFMLMQKKMLPLIMPAVPHQCRICTRPAVDTKRQMLALATAESLTVNGWTSWVVVHFQDRFNDVPAERLMRCLWQEQLPQDVRRLIHRACDTADSGAGRLGPLFDLLHEAYRHASIDQVWREDVPGRPLLRIGAEFVVLCRHGEDPEPAKLEVLRFVEGGTMPVDRLIMSVRDLDVDTAIWAGYAISGDIDELELRLTAGPWRHLVQALEPMSGTGTKSLAWPVLIRWLNRVAPALPWTDFREGYAGICESFEHQRIDHVPPPGLVRSWWKGAIRRWRRVQRRVRDEASA